MGEGEDGFGGGVVTIGYLEDVGKGGGMTILGLEVAG